MTVRDFLLQHPEAELKLMTPGGFISLTPEQGKDLLAGKSAEGHAGIGGFVMETGADELLREPVEQVQWEKHVCHILTGYPQDEMQEEKENRMAEQGVSMC